MKNLILTTVLSLTIFSGLQAQETYYCLLYTSDAADEL
mgnify:CR=1 FL=1